MTDEIKLKKPIWKKWWFWLIAIFVIIIIASSGGEEKKETTPEQQLPQEQTQPQETPQTPQEEEKESTEEPPITNGQPEQQPTQEQEKPACEPSQEICDSVDNDCDGSVDENLTQQCGTSNVGACKFGTKTCRSGNWGECIGAVNSTNEICDGIDNDCDGSVDEGGVCVEPTWHTVTTFAGSSPKNTQSFSIKGEKWRVEWNCQLTGEFESGNFSVFAEPVGGGFEDLVANTMCPANDITYFYEGGKTYYFEVSSLFVNWSLSVKDFY